MMIKRLLSSKILTRMEDPKAIILIGPRQVGKTTLLKNLVKEIDTPVTWWNGDEPDIRSILNGATSTFLKEQIGRGKLVVIDEAQRIFL